MRIALGILAAAFAASVQGGQCAAKSGPNTAALVELYTSEGCSSCPPADRWLSSLSAQGHVPERVVPLALHVDYWDYIGWKDPYAKREFSLRQRKLTQLQRLALTYTPQVMLQGRDFRGWGTPAFEQALTKINAQAPRAELALELLPGGPGTLVVRVSATVLDARQAEEVGLYLASYENRLESRVSAGENRGRTLSHDHVVLEWQGPLAFSGSRLVQERALPLLPGAQRANSGVVAFVQNRRTAEVLQVLMLPSCT
ncbi:MAG TPA: DUF1223 domain-containing protein [Burkholderiales bacterium]|jgi:hypothetical protein